MWPSESHDVVFGTAVEVAPAVLHQLDVEACNVGVFLKDALWLLYPLAQLHSLQISTEQQVSLYYVGMPILISV